MVSLFIITELITDIATEQRSFLVTPHNLFHYDCLKTKSKLHWAEHAFPKDVAFDLKGQVEPGFEMGSAEQWKSWPQRTPVAGSSLPVVPGVRSAAHPGQAELLSDPAPLLCSQAHKPFRHLLHSSSTACSANHLRGLKLPCNSTLHMNFEWRERKDQWNESLDLRDPFKLLLQAFGKGWDNILHIHLCP